MATAEEAAPRKSNHHLPNPRGDRSIFKDLHANSAAVRAFPYLNLSHEENADSAEDPCDNYGYFTCPHALDYHDNGNFTSPCDDHEDLSCPHANGHGLLKCPHGHLPHIYTFKDVQEESAGSAVPCTKFAILQPDFVDPCANCAKDSTTCPLADPGDFTCQHGDPEENSGVEHPSFDAEFPQPSSSECNSTTSIVTHATLEKVTGLDKAAMNAISLDTQWTDAKHRSYLTFMEENFVENLYDRKYCALDVCGQAPPQFESVLPKFKFWRYGDWHQKSMAEWIPPTYGVWSKLRNPWIDFFRHQIASNERLHIKVEHVSSSSNIEEGEEVDSPSTATSHRIGPHLENERISSNLHSSRLNEGLRKRIYQEHGDVIVDASKQVVPSKGLDHDTTHLTNFSNSRKRSVQLESEQGPSTRLRIETPAWASRVENKM